MGVLAVIAGLIIWLILRAVWPSVFASSEKLDRGDQGRDRKGRYTFKD